MTRKKQKTRSQTKNPPLKSNQTLTFIEHVHELRRRLLYIALSVGVFTAAAYSVQMRIVDALLKPAGKQQFIYTSPAGGIDFLFRVCLYTAIACSIPVIFYQILKYIEPLIARKATRFIATGSIISALLALIGVLFGYFIGLPAAMHFLLHQFTSSQIHPLVTAQSYINFVTVYLLGSALMFQIPLVILFINRIRPIKSKTLFHYERWVILLAFVASGIMNPTPDIRAQLLVAGPIIISYQIGIIMVALSRKPKHRGKIARLIDQDKLTQSARAQKLLAAKPFVAKEVASKPAVASYKAVDPAVAQQSLAARGRDFSFNRPIQRHMYLNNARV